jgi:DNA (cytosine-5)-methyltransferase 1
VKHLDLFSGIGGFALAARWVGIETVQFVEFDPYAQKVLAKNFPDVPIHGDIHDFKADEFCGVGLLTGGYPCQPFSLAGERRGKEDDRHLWPEMLRIIREARPDWVLAENVAGHVSMGLDEVLSDLENEGYTTQTLIIPACAKDAPHRRDRVWIIANSKRMGWEKRSSKGIQSKIGLTERQESEHICEGLSRNRNVADSASARCKEQRRGKPAQTKHFATERKGQWFPEPAVGRVAHGVPSRVDRLKGLGNAIVPQVAYEIMKGIYDTNNQQYCFDPGSQSISNSP